MQAYGQLQGVESSSDRLPELYIRVLVKGNKQDTVNSKVPLLYPASGGGRITLG